MASSREYLDFILEQLSGLEIPRVPLCTYYFVNVKLKSVF